MRLSRPHLTGPALLAACAFVAFCMELLHFFNSSSSFQLHPAAAVDGDARVITSIAYFVQITDDNIGNVPRLLSALYHPDNIYALHADMRCAKERVDKINNLIAGNEKYDNVRLMPQTHVTHKVVTMVLNTVEGIVFLLQWSTKWTYFINLSGSDYPLLPQDGIIELLHNTPCPRNNTSSMEENIPSFINFAEPISRWRELVIDPGLSEVQADLLYAVRNRTTSGLRFMVRKFGVRR